MITTTDDGVTPDFPDRLSSSTSPIDSFFFLTELQKLKNHDPLTLTHFLQLFSVIVLINLLHPFLLSTTLSSISLFYLLIGKNLLLSLFIKKDHTIIHPTTGLFLSLVLVACKVMESIIHDFIPNFLLSNNLLSKHQHGFIKNRSNLTCLLSSLKNWLSSLDLAESTDAIYIDFAEAFDTVTQEKLLYNLTSYGIRGELHLWISAWPFNRTQSVCIEGLLSPPKSVLSGVLQGFVLGPF